MHNFHIQMKFLNQHLSHFVHVSKVDTEIGLNVPNHLNVSNCRVAPKLNSSYEAMSAPLTRRNYCSPTEQRQPRTSLHGVRKISSLTRSNMGYTVRVRPRVQEIFNQVSVSLLSLQGKIR